MSYSHAYKRKNSKWWNKFKSEQLDTSFVVSTAAVIVYALVFVVTAYYLLRRSNVLPPNAFRKFLWRSFVYTIPPPLVIAMEKRDLDKIEDPAMIENSYAATRTFGAKSEAVRRFLNLGSNPKNDIRVDGDNDNGLKDVATAALPGLFNRDNECYQNSVIQGLASLQSFCDFTTKLPSFTSHGGHATLTGALQLIIAGLNDADNVGRGLWTPWALKSMSSWQQQDAQEYFSRIVDEMEKDVSRYIKSEPKSEGSLALRELDLESNNALPVVKGKGVEGEGVSSEGLQILSRNRLSQLRNPLEGLQAQRVGCLKCGFVEGLSLIPFNCLTVSLGRQNYYDIETLLDMYTELETISGVECANCTLLRQESMLEQMLKSRPATSSVGSEDPRKGAFFEAASSRLKAVKTALADRDFSESALTKKCAIPSKSRVTTDKTKQSVIARSPQSLVLHINRSVFDEYTGAQLKNYAKVKFPRILNLDPWCLGSNAAADSEAVEKWETNPARSMVAGDLDKESEPKTTSSQSKLQIPKSLYKLRAVITHYGTHGDGHYIAYRQSPHILPDGSQSEIWWRLSDDDVFQVSEETVLAQGGVFMLFYEKLSEEEASAIAETVAESPVPEFSDSIENMLSPASYLSPEILAALNSKLETLTNNDDEPTAEETSTLLRAEGPAQEIHFPESSASEGSVSQEGSQRYRSETPGTEASTITPSLGTDLEMKSEHIP
jgi:ubiquitin carboxyl-terminal hydrolase 1